MKKKIKNISIQGRIYPEIVQSVVSDAKKQGKTPTLRAAEILAEKHNLPKPKRKNARKEKKNDTT